MKAVIPVAGFGTRMLPASKAIPKELITLVDKPLIQYVVNELALAGIREVVFITHAAKTAIENHFDTTFELESQLEARSKTEILSVVRSVAPADMRFSSVRQSRGQGLGHAIACAHAMIGDEDFIVVLPDVLISDIECDHRKDNLAAMLKRYQETGISQVLVEDVPVSEVTKYGIADVVDIPEKGMSASVKGFVEKPSQDEAPSNLAVVGRYILTKSIWPILSETQPGVGGEVQLTDAIDRLLKQESVEVFRMTGRSYDCGGKAGYIETFLAYVAHHPEYNSILKSFLS